MLCISAKRAYKKTGVSLSFIENEAHYLEIVKKIKLLKESAIKQMKLKKHMDPEGFYIPVALQVFINPHAIFQIPNRK